MSLEVQTHVSAYVEHDRIVSTRLVKVLRFSRNAVLRLLNHKFPCTKITLKDHKIIGV